MKKISVLFVCIHNSARSQIAEELLTKLYGDYFTVKSAGYEPSFINPYVAKVLLKRDIDISKKQTQSVFDLYKNGEFFNYIITVCNESENERCPIFPGVKEIIHWSFNDPSMFSGSDEDKYIKIENLINDIEQKINEWVKTFLQINNN